MEYIRRYYGVPAKRGQRVCYTYKGRREGTITGARNQYILVRLDGENRTGAYHPTWEMEYLAVGEPKEGSDAK
jgi:hypothetical protein